MQIKGSKKATWSHSEGWREVLGDGARAFVLWSGSCTRKRGHARAPPYCTVTPPDSCETEAPSQRWRLMEPTGTARVVALPAPRRAVLRLCLHRIVPPDPAAAPVRGADHSCGGSTSNRGDEGDIGGGGEEKRGRFAGGRRAIKGGVLVPRTGNDDKVFVLLILGDGERRSRIGCEAGSEHGGGVLGGPREGCSWSLDGRR